MIIKIDDTFSVDCSDQNNFTLKESYIGKKDDGTPKQAERTHGYFGSFRHAVERYVDRKIHASGATDLTAVLAKLDEIQGHIQQLPARLRAS